MTRVTRKQPHQPHRLFRIWPCWHHRSYSRKVGAMPKEGWAWLCAPILLFVWQRQRPLGRFSRDTRRTALTAIRCGRCGLVVSLADFASLHCTILSCRHLWCLDSSWYSRRMKKFLRIGWKRRAELMQTRVDTATTVLKNGLRHSSKQHTHPRPLYILTHLRQSSNCSHIPHTLPTTPPPNPTPGAPCKSGWELLWLSQRVVWPIYLTSLSAQQTPYTMPINIYPAIHV